MFQLKPNIVTEVREKKYPIFLFSLLFTATTGWAQQVQNSRQDADAIISLKIINVSNQTYGYDIFVKQKLKIHQPTIPCVRGQQGFASAEDAQKIGQLMIDKMRKGEMPPTVTMNEMKKMKIKIP